MTMMMISDNDDDDDDDDDDGCRLAEYSVSLYESHSRGSDDFSKRHSNS